MYCRRRYAKYYLGLILLLSLAGQARADDEALNEPGIQRTLQAMSATSTWYHPDLFGEFAGIRHYSRHEYRQALKFFEMGAQYADKLSQLCIGLMYMNGEGVAKDLVTAYAWMDLAAERNYPDFVVTRDALKTQLTPEQLAQAMALRASLAAKYGDGVAKHRLAVQLHQGQMHLTGSHTGFNFGNSSISTVPFCGAAFVVGGTEQPQVGCGGSLFETQLWNPELYFAARDREFKATVKVGSVQEQSTGTDQNSLAGSHHAERVADPTLGTDSTADLFRVCDVRGWFAAARACPFPKGMVVRLDR